jgi:hypothetical protein
VITLEHIDAAAAWCDYSIGTIAKTFVGRIPGKAGSLLAAVRDAYHDGITGVELHKGTT